MHMYHGPPPCPCPTVAVSRKSAFTVLKAFPSFSSQCCGGLPLCLSLFQHFQFLPRFLFLSHFLFFLHCPSLTPATRQCTKCISFVLSALSNLCSFYPLKSFHIKIKKAPIFLLPKRANSSSFKDSPYPSYLLPPAPSLDPALTSLITWNLITVVYTW